MLEILTSCALRGCFEVSDGYERRMDYTGRIGTALHRTLEAVTTRVAQSVSEAALVAEARSLFQEEMAAQDALRAARPRERWLPVDQRRLERAEQAVIIEAQLLFRSRVYGTTDYIDRDADGTATVTSAQVEVPVMSRDRLFRGRIDRAEPTADGTRILDYKSAHREDLPGRYARQIQLYALLWRDTVGEWPTSAAIVYLLTGATHAVPVDPDSCEQVASDYRRVVGRLRPDVNPETLATPGDACTVCEFKPWCRPLWRWLGEVVPPGEDMRRAGWGFEGDIRRLEMVNGQWLLHLGWKKVTIRLVAPEARFPHLATARIGDHVRALDFRLEGLMHQPLARVTPYSELFLLMSG